MTHGSLADGARKRIEKLCLSPNIIVTQKLF